MACRGWGRWAALGAFLVAIAQIPMGGITIALDLHPLAVMTHFLLGLTALGLALIAVLEAWSLRDGLASPAGAHWFRWIVTWVGLPACIALVVTGAVATASGPHPGSSDDVERLGLGIVGHRVRARSGRGGLRHRRSRRSAGSCSACAPTTRASSGSGSACSSVLIAQAILGEVQYRNALPWGLVLVHVVLASAIWAFSLALAFALWRPPAPLSASVGFLGWLASSECYERPAPSSARF